MALIDLQFGQPAEFQPRAHAIAVGVDAPSQCLLSISACEAGSGPTTLSQRAFEARASFTHIVSGLDHFLMLLPADPCFDSCVASYLLTREIDNPLSRRTINTLLKYCHERTEERTPEDDELTPYRFFLALRQLSYCDLELLDRERTNTRERIVTTTWELLDHLTSGTNEDGEEPLTPYSLQAPAELLRSPIGEKVKKYYNDATAEFDALRRNAGVTALRARASTTEVPCLVAKEPAFGAELCRQLAATAELPMTLLYNGDKGRAEVVEITLDAATAGDLLGLAPALDEAERVKRELFHIEQAGNSHNSRHTGSVQLSKQARWRDYPHRRFNVVCSPHGGTVLSHHVFVAVLRADELWRANSAADAITALEQDALHQVSSQLQSQNLLFETIANHGSPVEQAKAINLIEGNNNQLSAFLRSFGHELHADVLQLYRRHGRGLSWLLATDMCAARGLFSAPLDYSEPRDLTLELLLYLHSGGDARIPELIDTLATHAISSHDATEALCFLDSAFMNHLLADQIARWSTYIRRAIFDLWRKLERRSHSIRDVIRLHRRLRASLSTLASSQVYRLTLLQKLRLGEAGVSEHEIILASALYYAQGRDERTRDALRQFTTRGMAQIAASPFCVLLPNAELVKEFKHHIEDADLPLLIALSRMLTPQGMMQSEWRTAFTDKLDALVNHRGRGATGAKKAMTCALLLRQLSEGPAATQNRDAINTETVSTLRQFAAHALITVFFENGPTPCDEDDAFASICVDVIHALPIEPEITRHALTCGLSKATSSAVSQALANHILMLLTAWGNPSERLNFLISLMRLPSANELIAVMLGHDSNLTPLLRCVQAMALSESFTGNQLRDVPLPLATQIAAQISGTAEARHIVQTCDDEQQTRLSRAVKALRACENLPAKENWPASITALLRSMRRRLDVALLGKNLESDFPFVRGATLLTERVFALLSSDVLATSIDISYQRELGNIIGSDTGISAVQRQLLAATRDLCEQAFAVVTQDTPGLADISADAAELRNRCTEMTDRFGSHADLLFVREVIAAIHAWAAQLSNTCSRLLTALENHRGVDTEIGRLLPQAISAEMATRLFDSGSREAVTVPEAMRLGTAGREWLLSVVVEEQVKRFDLPGAERLMQLDSEPANRPSGLLRLLTFKSSLALPCYFLLWFVAWAIFSKVNTPAAATTQAFISGVMLFWLPLAATTGVFAVLAKSGVIRRQRHRLADRYPKGQDPPRRSLVWELLLPRYLISICFGVTTAVIMEMDFGLWGRLGGWHLLVIPALLGLSLWSLHRQITDAAPRNDIGISLDIFAMLFSQATMLSLAVTVFFSQLIDAPDKSAIILYKIPAGNLGNFSYYPILALVVASVGLFFATFIEGIIKGRRRL